MGWAKCMEDNLRPCEGRETFFSDVRCDYFPVLISDEVITETRLLIFQNATGKKNEYQDRFIECRSCGCEFRFSAEAQKEYEKKGWKPPRRCRKCREKERRLQQKKGLKRSPSTYSSWRDITWATRWAG